MKIEYTTPKIKVAVFLNNHICVVSQNTGGSWNEGFDDDGTGETELG